MRRLKDHFYGKTHIIWDWNGTLLDDLEMTLSIVADTCEQHIGRRLSKDEYLELFRFPIRDYYEELGFDFTRVSFEQLSVQFMQHYRERVQHCQLFDGTAELLDVLRQERIACSILTAAHEDDVKLMLKHFGIDGFFQAVYGLSEVYAHSKVARGHPAVSGRQPKKIRVVAARGA